MEELQKYPAIYNKFFKDYKNKFIRVNIWKAIEEEFGLDAAEAKKYIRMSESQPRMADTWEINILFAEIAQKFCCRTQEHRWRPRARAFSLWSDRDDRMETSNRLRRPDRLEIFGNDWDDQDDHMETRL